MSRYFFHVDDGVVSTDTEGFELESLTIAKCEAVKLAGHIVSEAADTFWERGQWAMTVTGANRRELFSLHFTGESRTGCASLERLAQGGPTYVM